MLENAYIRKQFLQMQSSSDLCSLLNEIKASELAEKAYPITMKQLGYYSNPNHTDRRYKSFEIPKKTKGKFRKISAPCKELKSILYFLNIALQAAYDPAPCVMGFVPERSVVDNAKIHRGQKFIFNLDLENFFPSIEEPRIASRLQAKPYCLPKTVANVIAGLCCMRIETEEVVYEQNNMLKNFLFFFKKQKPIYKYKYVLPQGAPTSPILTNMICERLDRRLSGLAKRFGLRYSRYADDITFSSMHFVYAEKGIFRTELRKIIAGEKFSINTKKTRLLRKGHCQEVTGLIVSQDKVNVTRKYVKDVRAILHIWEKYGNKEAYKKFMPKYEQEKGHVKKCPPCMTRVIEGKLNYLKMVKGAFDSVYLKLNAQFKRVIITDPETAISPIGISYLATYTLPEFEEKMRGKLKISCEGGRRPKVLFINTDGKETNVIVSGKILTEEFENLCSNKKLAISLVKLNAKADAYLIHYYQSAQGKVQMQTGQNKDPHNEVKLLQNKLKEYIKRYESNTPNDRGGNQIDD